MKTNNYKFNLNHISLYEKRLGIAHGLIPPRAMEKIKAYVKAFIKLLTPIMLSLLVSECFAQDVDTGDQGTETAFAKAKKYLDKTKWFIFGFCVPVGMYRGIMKDDPKKGGGMAILGVGAPIVDGAIKQVSGLVI